MKEKLSNLIMNYCFKNSQLKEKMYQYPTQHKRGSPHFKVEFSGLSEKYCVGFVDLVNSTIISANMDEINDIARRNGDMPVIEDAAQSFGALYKEKKSCNLSTIGCTSFFPSKPLGCYGDGGAIFTSDDDIAQACREIRVHGQSQRYVHTRVGVGGRMDTMQCAIVLAKLGVFEREVQQRNRARNQYRPYRLAYRILIYTIALLHFQDAEEFWERSPD